MVTWKQFADLRSFRQDSHCALPLIDAGYSLDGSLKRGRLFEKAPFKAVAYTAAITACKEGLYQASFVFASSCVRAQWKTEEFAASCSADSS